MSAARRFHVYTLITVLGLALPGLALAKKPAEKKPAKTPYEEVLAESGLERQLAEVPRSLYMGMQYTGTQKLGEQGFNKAQLTEFSKRISAAYDHKRSMQQALKHLRGNLRSRDVTKILAWLRSPSGKVISRAEQSAANDAAIGKMQAYFDSLQQTPPPKHFQDAIAAIMKAQSAIDITSRMNVEADLLGEAAVRTVRQEFDQDSFTNLVREEIIRSSIPDAQMLNGTREFFMFTYRDVPEQDLHRYVAFLQSEAGKRFSYAVVSTYLEVLETGRDQLTSQMYGQPAIKATLAAESPNFPPAQRATDATARRP